MNKKLVNIAQKLHLKQSAASIWGEIDQTFVQVFALQDNGTSYNIFFHLNHLISDLPEKIAAHPSLENKFKAKNFSWDPSEDQGKKVYRLIYEGLSFGLKDKSEEFIPKLIQAFNEVVPTSEKNLSGICEQAEGNTICSKKYDKPRVINNLLSFYCATCIDHLQRQVGDAQKELADLSPSYLKGAVFGFAGALAGAALWLAPIIFLQRDFLILSIASGFACGYLYGMGAGKIDHVGKGLIFVLTLLGFFMINCLHISYLVYQQTQAFDLVYVVTAYTQNLIAEPGAAFVDYLFPLIGAVYTVFTTQTDSIDLVIEE